MSINREKFEALSRKAPKIDVPDTDSENFVDVSKLDLNGLLSLRLAIDARLPARALADVDLEEELVIQFTQTKTLLNDVVTDDDTPANQKSQVINSCTAILGALTKMQSELYAAERVKALEAALIKALRTLPESTQLAFFAEYERLYEASKAASK